MDPNQSAARCMSLLRREKNLRVPRNVNRLFYAVVVVACYSGNARG